MTREEAFKILNEWVEISKLSEDYNKDEGFLYTDIGTITYGDIEEAIKTLKQEPYSDAISRAYIEPIIEELENICVNGDEHILDLLADIKRN